jgi:hypothetical protein
VIASLLVGLLMTATSVPALASDAGPCNDPEHRAFDFFIGRWDAFDSKSGELSGSSVIEPIFDGCALRESWRETELTGGSVSAYDARTQTWRQTWTDSRGAWREFVGGRQDGKMVLVWKYPSQRNPGHMAHVRLTYTQNADGTVRQYSDQSADDGITWVERYDLTYRRAR